MEHSGSRRSKASLPTSTRRSEADWRQFDDDTEALLLRNSYTWSCFTMTPPSALTKERLTEKSHDLSLEMQRRFVLSQPPVISVRHCANLGSTTSRHPSLFISVSFMEAARHTKLHGLFSRVDSDQYRLFLCRGSKRVKSLVVEFVADTFSCYVNPLLLRSNDLAFGLAYWSAPTFRDTAYDLDPITIELRYPIVTDFAVELSLPVGRIGQVLGVDRVVEEDDGLKALAVFYESTLLTRLGLNCKSCELQSVTTPGLGFDADGVVCFFKREFVGEALAYLTKVAEGKVEPEIEERSVEAGD